jgi:hypothetical protein
MLTKHRELMAQLISAVYRGKGVTDPSLRTAVKTAVAPGNDQLESDDSPIPVVLRTYLRKVGRHAYKVTDQDLETLKVQGYSEEAIFELTVSAAVGAGLGRLQKGLAALNRGQVTSDGDG